MQKESLLPQNEISCPCAAKNKYSEHIPIISIFTAALVLRVLNIGRMSIWLDEGIGISIARRSLGEMFHFIALDVHPPLSYIFLKAQLLISQSPIFLRWGSVVLGIAALITFYLAMSRRAVPCALRLCLLFLAISPVAVHYSQEIRMYALLFLLVNLTLWAAVRFAERSDATGFFIFLTSATAAIYTHYIAGIYVLGLLVFIGWERAAELKNWKMGMMDAARTALCIFILYLPWFGTFCEHLISGSFSGKHAQSHWEHFSRMAFEYFTQTIGGVMPWVPFGLWGWLIFACIFTLVFIRGIMAMRSEKGLFRLMVSVLMTGFILLVLHLAARGRFYPRAFIIYLSLIFYIIARGIVALSSNLMQILLLIYFALCLLVPTISYLSLDIRDVSLHACRILKDSAAQDEPIIHSSKFSYFPMKAYLPRHHQYLASTPNLLLQERLLAGKDVIKRSDVLQGRKRLWLVVEYWGAPGKWDESDMWTNRWLGPDWKCVPLIQLRIGPKACVLFKCSPAIP